MDFFSCLKAHHLPALSMNAFILLLLVAAAAKNVLVILCTLTPILCQQNETNYFVSCSRRKFFSQLNSRVVKYI